VSQTYKNERREKFTTGFGFLLAAFVFGAFAVHEVGEVPAGQRLDAWIQVGVAGAIVAIPTAVTLWRITPWPEVPEDQRGLPIVYGLFVAIGGSVGNYLMQAHPSGERIFLGIITGFFFACGVVFLLVGALRQWISKDPTFRRL
jgi:hypothetical protein